MKSSTCRAAAAALALALFGAACGSDGDDVATPDPLTTAPATPASELPTPDDAGTVDVASVMEELAAMPYEERIGVIEEKAREEGAVLLYGSPPVELQEDWSKAFQDAYPEINMLYVRSKAGETGERLKAEARANRNLVDVVAVNAIVGSDLHAEELLADHHGAPIPPDLPERFVSEWSAALFLIPNLIAWNTDLVSPEEAPTSLDDLLDPKWKGQVHIDVDANNFVSGLVHSRGEDGAEEYVRALVEENDAQVRKGHTAAAQLLAAGEFKAAVELYADGLEKLQEDGAPIEWLAPEPTAANATGVSIYKHSPRPHAAALLMNFLLSEAGASVGGLFGYLPTNPNAELEYEDLRVFVQDGTPESARLLPVTPDVAAESFDPALRILEEYLAPNIVN